MVQVHVTDQDGVTLVQVNGRVDSGTASSFGSGISSPIDDGHTRLVLDLSGVDYMSSAGLRELVSALKKVKRAQGNMVIATPTDRVREVMEMAGLDTIFSIFDSQDDALASY